MTGKNLNPLPKSDDEYWEGAEKYIEKPFEYKICETHNKNNWTEHAAYIDNGDGTVGCAFCNWGFRLPGYMRILGGRIVDLREKQSASVSG